MSLSLSIGDGWSFCRLRKTPTALYIPGAKMGISQNVNHLTEEATIININDKPKTIPISSDLPPLVSALKASAERNAAAFHFPGHKRGEAAPSSMTELIGKKPFLHDFNDLPELDSFYCPNGPLLEATKLAAELFGAKETWFLVGGSSCGVQAAIMATCSPGDTIILPRNAHISATTGVIFSGAIPKYIIPEHNPDWDIASGVTPAQVNSAIKESEMKGQKVAAVFVTSPTYNGICSNVSEISKMCHSQGIPLIVDEAHGAHFKFHPEMPKTALDQGADISIQSTHKVLCSFSQSSMLHISGETMIDRERLQKCLHFLQTSSPSWLLLASLDAARHQLSTNPNTIFNETVKLAKEAKILISKIPGISILDLSAFPDSPAMDPLRITIGVRQLGLSGFQANEILDNNLGIVPELVGINSVTLAFSLGTTREHVNRLVCGLKHLSATFLELNCEKENIIVAENAPYSDSVMSLSPREAFFASKMKMEFKECVGEICGEFICPYPPGIPVLVPGEMITEKALDYLQQMKRYGCIIVGIWSSILPAMGFKRGARRGPRFELVSAGLHS